LRALHRRHKTWIGFKDHFSNGYQFEFPYQVLLSVDVESLVLVDVFDVLQFVRQALLGLPQIVDLPTEDLNLRIFRQLKGKLRRLHEQERAYLAVSLLDLFAFGLQRIRKLDMLAVEFDPLIAKLLL
jgi:hypothetical protein